MHLRRCEGRSSKAFAYLRCQLTLSSWGHAALVQRSQCVCRGRENAVFTLLPSCVIYFTPWCFHLTAASEEIRSKNQHRTFKSLMKLSLICFLSSLQNLNAWSICPSYAYNLAQRGRRQKMDFNNESEGAILWRIYIAVMRVQQNYYCISAAAIPLFGLNRTIVSLWMSFFSTQNTMND